MNYDKSIAINRRPHVNQYFRYRAVFHSLSIYGLKDEDEDDELRLELDELDNEDDDDEEEDEDTTVK